MTDGAYLPTFSTNIAWLFLTPIALAGALSLAVNYLIWPEDSVENYLGVLNNVLSGFKLFVHENSTAFLDVEEKAGATSLPTLHSRIHGDILLLIDCKHAVQREVIFSRLSNRDISHFTRSVKHMYPGMHCLGLSNIMEKELRKDADPKYFAAFEQSVALMKEPSTKLTENLVSCLDKIQTCLAVFMPRPRSKLNSILWPFPRLFSSSTSKEDQLEAAQQLDVALNDLKHSLDRFFAEQKTCGLDYYMKIIAPTLSGQKEEVYVHGLPSLTSDNVNGIHSDSSIQTIAGPMFLVFLYQQGLRDFAKYTIELATDTQKATAKRTTRQIYWPTMSLKKWLLSSPVDSAATATDSSHTPGASSSAVGAAVPLMSVQTITSNRTNADYSDLDLVRTMTKPDLDRSSTKESAAHAFASRVPTNMMRGASSGPLVSHYRPLATDPDVDPPATCTEQVFSVLYRFFAWFGSIDTLFALKTAVGICLLAIPAWMPANAGWYNEWRGQWAMITLCLWSFPTSGLFYFGIIARVLGSVVGAVLGIAVWEICQGNPYALAVVLFILFVPHYHIFFHSSVYRVAALMSNITMLLVVIYAFNSVQTGPPETVYIIAGKRLLLIVLGLGATGVLLAIPAPVQGRIELRKRLAVTVNDIGRLYSIITAEIAAPGKKFEHTTKLKKAFMKLCVKIRRQIADERNLLAHTKYEPPLRGKFPFEHYAALVQTVDNLADLIVGMAYSVRDIENPWRDKIAQTMLTERREYFAAIMTTLKLISTTLSSKSALPPYMMPPSTARQRFARVLEHQISLQQQDLADPSLTAYGAYMMNGSAFVTELQSLLREVTILVGTEDPELWLTLHA
ncbi:hypothetical protein DM01DRAFT_1094193 [Hesseltinella vesiculosa]|uniref:Uncharacterized protein n=1 Tax=Hesseltinella vesiculosa TaxID=101127 RepID=A0A1X2GC26_9FUNG|nr:hypothetical protein DM01DRAFT_1094193 [Hesseltinella vesiculosa]